MLYNYICQLLHRVGKAYLLFCSVHIKFYKTRSRTNERAFVKLITIFFGVVDNCLLQCQYIQRMIEQLEEIDKA